jgi:hypothetical protein
VLIEGYRRFCAAYSIRKEAGIVSQFAIFYNFRRGLGLVLQELAQGQQKTGASEGQAVFRVGLHIAGIVFV